MLYIQPSTVYLPLAILMTASATLAFAAVCILLWRNQQNPMMSVVVAMGIATVIHTAAFGTTHIFFGMNPRAAMKNTDLHKIRHWLGWTQMPIVTATEAVIFLMGSTISQLIYERAVLLRHWNTFIKDDGRRRIKFMIWISVLLSVILAVAETFILFILGGRPGGIYSTRPKIKWIKSISAVVYSLLTIFVVFRSLQVLFSQFAAHRELARLYVNGTTLVSPRNSVASASSQTSSTSTFTSMLYFRLTLATLLYALYGSMVAGTSLQYAFAGSAKLPEISAREYATAIIGLVFFMVFATTEDARKCWIPSRKRSPKLEGCPPSIISGRDMTDPPSMSLTPYTPADIPPSVPPHAANFSPLILPLVPPLPHKSCIRMNPPANHGTRRSSIVWASEINASTFRT